MEQLTRYKELDRDLLQECRTCRVSGGCKSTDDKCGWKRGVKYGLYPRDILDMPRALIHRDLANQIRYGFGCKEVPLFTQTDKMGDFTDKVAAYKEPWMAHHKWESV